MQNIYINTATNELITATLLTLRGIPLDVDTLKKLKLALVVPEYPVYDSAVEQIVPIPDLREEKDYYVQDFNIIELSTEEQQSNLNKKAEEKRKAALSGADAVLAPYLDLFSSVEKDTWFKQQAEVEAWILNKEAPTPTIDALAKERGITRLEQLAKAVKKIETYVPLSSTVIGTQQRYEDTIKNIVEDTTKSIKDRMQLLDNLTFEYSI